jgi:hypothetical protein
MLAVSGSDVSGAACAGLEVRLARKRGRRTAFAKERGTPCGDRSRSEKLGSADCVNACKTHADSELVAIQHQAEDQCMKQVRAFCAHIHSFELKAIGRKAFNKSLAACCAPTKCWGRMSLGELGKTPLGHRPR